MVIEICDIKVYPNLSALHAMFVMAWIFDGLIRVYVRTVFYSMNVLLII